MPVSNMAYKESEVMQGNPLTPLMESMDTPRIFQQNGPASLNTIQQYGIGEQQNPALDAQEYASLSNTFKVSHLVRPRHYQASQRLLNLQKPKSCMRDRPKNIFDASDFRGLLHADYKETIKSAFSKGSLSSTAKEAQEGIFVNSPEPRDIKPTSVSTKNTLNTKGPQS